MSANTNNSSVTVPMQPLKTQISHIEERVTIDSINKRDQMHLSQEVSLNNYSHIWIKRRSPEWKPRRASVATCQLQYPQCNSLYRPITSRVDRYSEQERNQPKTSQQRLMDWNCEEEPKSRQSLGPRRRATTSHLDEDEWTSRKAKPSSWTKEWTRTPMTMAGKQQAIQNPAGKHQSEEFEAQGDLRESPIDRANHPRQSQDSRSSSYASQAVDCQARRLTGPADNISESKVTGQVAKRNERRFEFTSTDKKPTNSSSREQLDSDVSTCCIEQFKNKQVEGNSKLTNDVNDSQLLHLRQRKYHILSIALKRMISERKLTCQDFGCCEAWKCNQRNFKQETDTKLAVGSCGFGEDQVVARAEVSMDPQESQVPGHILQFAETPAINMVANNERASSSSLATDEWLKEEGEEFKNEGESEAVVSSSTRISALSNAIRDMQPAKLDLNQDESLVVRRLQSISTPTSLDSSTTSEIVRLEGVRYQMDNPMESCENCDFVEPSAESRELDFENQDSSKRQPTIIMTSPSDGAQRQESLERIKSTGDSLIDIDVDKNWEDFESLIIESWLDENPLFVQDYFMRKASHQLVDDWLTTQAKVGSNSNINLSSVIHKPKARPASQQFHPNEPRVVVSTTSDRRIRGDSLRPRPNTADIHSTQTQAFQDTQLMFTSNQKANFEQHRFSVSGIGSHDLDSLSPASSVSALVRKISATDFETRAGNGFLGPILSKTPDGKPTFVSQPTSSEVNWQSNVVTPARRDRFSIGCGSDVAIACSGLVTSSLSRGSRQPPQIVTPTPPNNNTEILAHDLVENLKTPFECNKSNLDPNEPQTEPKSHNESAEDCDLVTETKSINDEVRVIFELVKNICDDLDIRTLLHKILKNIAVLINADKSSLFLVCGEAGDPNRYLMSQLFNVDQESEVEELPQDQHSTPSSSLPSDRSLPNSRANPKPSVGVNYGSADRDCICIPWGTGLVGYVAESGESVNIENCYEDPRFTDAIDQRTGYVTHHMLCAPIYDKRNEIVGVAQVINKRDGRPFSQSDELKFKQYLQFCGIGLRNAQSYEQSQLQNKRNQVLLDLARMVFEEQSTIEQVVHRIMFHTQSLLECQRCQVLLIDDGSYDLDQLLHLPTNSVNLRKQQSDQNNSVTDTNSSCSSSSSTAIVGGQAKPRWRPHCAESTSNSPNIEQVEFDYRESSQDDGESSRLSNDSFNWEDEETYCGSSKPITPKLFSLVFDLECDGNDPVMHSTRDEGPTRNQREQKFPINIGITGYVATTGETLNIENAHEHERFDPSVDFGSDFKHKSILCMPIRNGQRQIIGVSQLINKKNGRPFNKNDENLFEAFAIFCGLGIHNTLMYERVLKIMAKQRVTFEVLSYHATAPLEEAKKLHQEQIPSSYALDLTSLKFNDFSLDEQYMLKSCLRFFLDLDLIRRFRIDQLVFCNWILSVQKNYRKVTYHPIVGGNGLKASPVRYHNWRHAFNVTQMMFAILVNTQICRALGELETLALLIACLCHDLDHRGTNNSFQIKSASPLAELYSTSTMEHHHFDQCVMILNSQGNQILANLSPAEYSRVIVLLEEAILATDLANYFKKRDRFFQLLNSNQFEWHNNPEHRSLLRCMLMTACDVAAITKPWPVQKVVADLVMSEFYQQGDIEKNELNIEPIDMMNRDKMSDLPEMQISFIDTICAPIYSAFSKLFPKQLKPLVDGCLENRSLWANLANDKTRQIQLTSKFKSIEDRDVKPTSGLNVYSSNNNSVSDNYNIISNSYKGDQEDLNLSISGTIDSVCNPDVYTSSIVQSKTGLQEPNIETNRNEYCCSKINENENHPRKSV